MASDSNSDINEAESFNIHSARKQKLKKCELYLDIKRGLIKHVQEEIGDYQYESYENHFDSIPQESALREMLMKDEFTIKVQYVSENTRRTNFGEYKTIYVMVKDIWNEEVKHSTDWDMSPGYWSAEKDFYPD